MASKSVSAAETAWLDIWGYALSLLIPMIRSIERDHDEVKSQVRRDPKKARLLAQLSAETEWWPHYEMTNWRHASLAAVHCGLIPAVTQTLLSGFWQRNWLRPLLESLPKTEINPRSPAKAVAAARSTRNALSSFIITGETLNELVARADQDDDALRLAIRIDPLAIHCKPIRQRMARAIAEHDKSFLHRIGEALQNPKTITSEQYPELQYCLTLLSIFRQLPKLNEHLAEQLFLIRLAEFKLYAGDRRNLIRFIQRFRKRSATRKP